MPFVIALVSSLSERLVILKFIRILLNLDTFGILWYLTLRIFINQKYETWLRPFFSLEEHNTIIDVGASQGVHTLYFANIAKKVVAVEPENKNFMFLRALEKKHKNIIPVKVALSNKSGVVKLWKDSNALCHSIINNGDKFEVVPSKTLDQLVRQLTLTDVTLVKIDTEGAEHLIIEGGKTFFAQQKPILVIEYHKNKDALAANLQSLDYNWSVIKVGVGEHGWIHAYH